MSMAGLEPYRQLSDGDLKHSCWRTGLEVEVEQASSTGGSARSLQDRASSVDGKKKISPAQHQRFPLLTSSFSISSLARL